MSRLIRIIVALLWLIPMAASAATISRTDHVSHRIRQLVLAQAPGNQVTVGSLVALGQMHPCGKRLRMHLYGQGQYRNVRVSCPDQGWQLYVPVTVRSAQKVVVATRDLSAGVALTGSDIRMARPQAAVGGNSQIAHEESAVLGHTLRAPVGAGTPINLSNLAQAIRVHAGQSVTVNVRSNGVDIRTTAVAIQDGRVGQSILVKNPDSGHRYRVQVTAHGVVDDLSG